MEPHSLGADPYPGDHIELRSLRLVGYCGLLPEERTRKQPLEFDLDIGVDLARAAATDDLSETLDYGVVCDSIEQLLAEEQFLLLERLAPVAAERIAAMPGAQWVVLTVRKLRPPVPQPLGTAGVTVRRLAPNAGAPADRDRS